MQIAKVADRSESEIAVEVAFSDLLHEQQEYLSYRYSGFKEAEACELSEVDPTRVEAWRLEDDRYVEMERRLIRSSGGYRELRRQVLAEVWHRNLRLVYRYDSMILAKANGIMMEEYVADNGQIKMRKAKLTLLEQRYLLKLRGHYSADELDRIDRVENSDTGSNTIMNLIKIVNEYHVDGEM